MRIAVYPGSFDPVTNGHIDILNKTSKLFDKIIVAVVHNVTKTALFSLEERSRMIIESTRHLDNIEVECFNGLLADFVTGKDACAIIRVFARSTILNTKCIWRGTIRYLYRMSKRFLSSPTATIYLSVPAESRKLLY